MGKPFLNGYVAFCSKFPRPKVTKSFIAGTNIPTQEVNTPNTTSFNRYEYQEQMTMKRFLSILSIASAYSLMHLSETVTTSHLEKANALIASSICIHTDTQLTDVLIAEEHILRTISLGQYMTKRSVINSMDSVHGISPSISRTAIYYLRKKCHINVNDDRDVIQRVRSPRTSHYR